MADDQQRPLEINRKMFLVTVVLKESGLSAIVSFRSGSEVHANFVYNSFRGELVIERYIFETTEVTVKGERR